MPDRDNTTNKLLRAFSAEDYAILAPYLTRVELQHGQVLHHAHQLIERAYFLDHGVASIVSGDRDDVVEVGIYGREGMSASAVVLRAAQSALTSLIQIGSPTARVIASERLLDACQQSETLQAVLMRFVHVQNVQTASTAAANAQYALPERLARWLLMCHDRVESDRIELTHEFLAVMLAVRRSGVTVTLHTLEGAGAIRSTRGVVTILDRARLLEIAGSSYGVAEAELGRLFSLA